MIRINNIKMKLDYSEKELLSKIKNILKGAAIKKFTLIKRSLDCRDRNDIKYIISVDILLNDNMDENKIIKTVHNNNVMLTTAKNYEFPYSLEIEKSPKIDRPVIIGAGPAGYFAALVLAKAGFKPIVLERGKDVSERTKDIQNFWENKVLNQESNVSFGEGGAGTFSDGKLNTGIKDKEGRIEYILKSFVRYGAPENIIYDSKPHVGTDVLKQVMSNMRQDIISYGGEIRFNSKVSDISKKDDKYIITVDSVEKYVISASAVIIAIGHSARDTFKMLFENGFKMEQKPFAIGLRIEHKRNDIDKDRYGEKYACILPAASYKLTYHTSNHRSVFSFCMCPGGYVVNASSEEGCMVVNGMSYSGRNSDNSNSAIVCSITPEDFSGNSPLDGVEYQKQLEKTFYELCNGDVPIQKFGDFKDGNNSSSLGSITPCIKGKYSFGNLKECLPEYVSGAIIEGINAFGRQIKGFDSEDAILSGIESRTSSPVRILRDERLMSSYEGIVPCGEGAGYAGGITSAAVDGIKAAESIARYLLKK